MAKKINIDLLIGTEFNYLKVISEGKKHITKGGHIHRTILCVCKCGTTRDFQLSSVLNGSIKSCGCYSAMIASKRATERNTKHGLCNLKEEYNTWRSMKKRCLNESHKSYKDYGGRGITICNTWVNSFENFLNDMGKRPSKYHSLDRIDNNLGYSKSNCRWATKSEQCTNQRSNVLLKHNGVEKCVSEWSRIFGISRYRVIKKLS